MVEEVNLDDLNFFHKRIYLHYSITQELVVVAVEGEVSQCLNYFEKEISFYRVLNLKEVAAVAVTTVEISSNLKNSTYFNFFLIE